MIARLLTLLVFGLSRGFEIFDSEQAEGIVQNLSQKPKMQGWQWSDSLLLTDHGIQKMTADLYDTQIRANPWVILFVYERDNERRTPMNNYVWRLLKDIQPEGFQVAFVDVVEPEGELIKETFDIETFPSLVYVNEGLVYHMAPWGEGPSWSASDVEDFVRS